MPELWAREPGPRAVLQCLRHPLVAREHAARSLTIAERKGDVSLAVRVREQMAAVGVEVA